MDTFIMIILREYLKQRIIIIIIIISCIIFININQSSLVVESQFLQFLLTLPQFANCHVPFLLRRHQLCLSNRHETTT